MYILTNAIVLGHTIRIYIYMISIHFNRLCMKLKIVASSCKMHSCEQNLVASRAPLLDSKIYIFFCSSCWCCCLAKLQCVTLLCFWLWVNVCMWYISIYAVGEYECKIAAQSSVGESVCGGWSKSNRSRETSEYTDEAQFGFATLDSRRLGQRELHIRRWWSRRRWWRRPCNPSAQTMAKVRLVGGYCGVGWKVSWCEFICGRLNACWLECDRKVQLNIYIYIEAMQLVVLKQYCYREWHTRRDAPG